MTTHDPVYGRIRSELSARAEVRLLSLKVPASRSVRFYGSRRGTRYRVARFSSSTRARRVAQNLRTARHRLGSRVPRVHLDWLRNRVVVTEFVPGRVVERLGPSRLVRCARLLARLHNVDISSSRELGPMRSCFVGRLDKLVACARRAPGASRLVELDLWMWRYRRLRRRKWQRVLIHGDTHEANFVWRGDGAPALIDWDLSMAGAPHFDLAYMLYWRADALESQGRGGGFQRSVEEVLSAYNRAARGRRLTLRDLLLWLGCVCLAYVGFGQIVRDRRFAEFAVWLWDLIEEIAADVGISLD